MDFPIDLGALGIYFFLFVGLYFEVFLLISFLEKRPALKSSALPKHYPSVSMVVPCYNEENTIEGTIQSLLALSYPKEKLSIVVVDDGSEDKTFEIAKTFATNPQVRAYHKENGGKYTALNFGITHSSADIIGCLDADSFVAEDALIEAVKRFESEPSVMALTPAMKVSRPRNMLERMQSVEYTLGIFFKKMFDNIAALNVLPGPFSLYRREVFEQIGLFRRAHNTEDMEIAFRMHANGLKIVNAHNAYVYTRVPNTLRSLLRQRTRWSQGFLQNAFDYRYMFFNRRFGNFGVFALPLLVGAFIGGIYSALYVIYHISGALVARVFGFWVTGVPPELPTHLTETNWLYVTNGMMPFLVAILMMGTMLGIYLGHRIGKTQLTVFSFISYFALFGFLAPMWLIKATWGALRAQEATWR